MVDENDMVVLLAVTLAVALPTFFLLIGLACMRLHDSCDGTGTSIDQRDTHSDESEGESHVLETSVTRSSTYSLQRTPISPNISTRLEHWVRPSARANTNDAHIGGPNGSGAMTMGLDQSTIDSYPTAAFGERIISEESGDGYCSICLEKYLAEDVVRRLPCTHPFHVECIDPWLRIKAICPLCKERLFRVNNTTSKCQS